MITSKYNLNFDASKLSISILKKYLKHILTNLNIDDFTKYTMPEQYVQNPDYNTSYKVIQEMSIMSLKEWKKNLEETNYDIDKFYLDSSSDMEKDSKYYYDSFRVIQNQIGNHEVQFEFYKFFYEIIHELISRNFIDVDYTNYIGLDNKSNSSAEHSSLEMELPESQAIPEIFTEKSSPLFSKMTSAVSKLTSNLPENIINNSLPIPSKQPDQDPEPELQLEPVFDLGPTNLFD